MELAQQDIDARWHFYDQLSGVERTANACPEDGENGSKKAQTKEATT